jgi:hypothetical protein
MMGENAQSTTIDAYIHCDTLLPPRYVSGLTFRYFVDLSEYYEAGMAAGDLTAAINYAPNSGAISNFKPWDEVNHIYYVEGSWPKTANYGSIEFQFRLANYNTSLWDGGNDFSRKGLTGSLAVTQNIPLYLDGVKICGSEPTPGGTTPTPTKTPVPTVTPTPSVPVGGCAVSYVIQDSWSNGATIGLTIKNNGTSAINGWTLQWNLPANQKITNMWNASYTQSDNTVSVKNAAYNGTIPAGGGSVQFGFSLSGSGSGAKPSGFTLNGSSCGTY